ncbi:hypothetical protein HYH02_005097 [Chlamydomonas schloesseri]|uniref:C2 NT-type domain-containing protein n=1 Tax=Chlamydomonas schloesseri TaxID=2026947 RepID=A0A835WKU7_9CHLO|nr:hypothetical protein HYH02_005097 [Chlamydomonas schloesseri]|eukprot:KAG2449564.1 hypothetical protein HYH02_005097 [Chlamydomonas schloesseri]
MPVTLYKASSGHSTSNGGLGPFKKKCLILAVLETDGRTQATAALGRVVVDLSEYAAIEHQETRTFMVSCNKAIHAAVGDPQLMVTIRCRWKKLAREGGAAAGLPDETASMSTDTTGSRMTANLSSFLRFKFTGKGNEEQDLRGFESAGSLGGAPPGGNGNGPPAANGNRGSVAGDPLNKVMDTIQESHDEPAEPVFAGQLTPGGSRALTPQTSVKQLTPASSSQLAEPSPHASGANATETAAAGLGGMSLREMHAARAKAAMSGTPSPRRLDPGTGDSYGAGGRSPAEGSRAYPGSSVLPAAGSNLSLTAASAADSDLLVALRFELLTVAALEAGVYMARRPPGVGLGALTQSSSGAPPAASPGAMAAAKDPSAAAVRAAHAPARRLARTVLCMGSMDGPHFGASALRVIRAQVASAGDGLDVLAYWWSNAVHMRAMLGGLSLAAAAAGVLAPAAGGMGLAVAAAVSAGGASVGSLAGAISSLGGAPGAAAGGSEHWAAAALVPELKRLERAVFQELLGRMWERVLLPTVLGRAGGPRAAAPAAATKRALQEAAIKKWFEGLEAVCAALGKQVSGGHSALLRQQVLLAALKRVDLLLFAHLLGGADQPGVGDLLTDYDPHGSLAVSATGPAAAAPGSAAAAVAAAAATAGGAGGAGAVVIPQLDEASLPFAKGVLTFGGGMSVKMTVTRLQQWAAGQPLLGGGAAGADAGLAGAGNGGAGAVAGGIAGPGPLFPLLRAAADLLMMPKEMLVDRAVRLDVGAALSMRSVLHILERFQPDEFAQDSISPGILESLQEDAALPQIHLRSAAADANGGYVPPPDAVVLRGVETGSEPGLEYDAESEDELEELAQVVAKSPASSGAAVSTTVSPGGAAMAVRFRLLHDSWAAGMPRRRNAPSVASGSGLGM